MSRASVGVDLVEIARISRAVERWGERFLARVYTPGEISYCHLKSDPYPSLAARFAAKEAFVKALSAIGGGRANFRDVEVVRDGRGAPRLRLRIQPGCLEGKDLSVSLTHTREYAAACVMIFDGE